MNDFTKEELEFIWQKLAIANYENTEMHDLPNKVCAMIQNYCEHSHRQYYERVNVYECENCQMVML